MLHIENIKKPILIEFDTYRWLEHCGPNYDDNLQYRNKEETDRWINKCPIKQLQELLIEKEFITIDEVDNHLNNLEIEIKESFERTKKANFLPPESLFDDIYSE